MSTIASVAALAGVGVGTVSRVLNDSPPVSGSTRMRVLEAIEALDYEPSAAARALSTGRTSTIGVVAPFFTEPSVVERLRGVLARAGELGLPADPVRRRAARAASTTALRSLAVKGRVDGLLVVSLAPHRRAARAPAAAGVPVVLLDRRARGRHRRFTRRRGRRPARRRAPAARSATSASPSSATRRTNPFGFDSSARRRAGYEAALRDAGRRRRTGARAHRPAPPRRRARRRARAARAGRAADRDLRRLRPPGARRARGRDDGRRRRCPSGSRSSASTTSSSPATAGSPPSRSRWRRAARAAPTCCSTRSPAGAALAGAAARAPGEERPPPHPRDEHERRGKPSGAHAPAEWHDARAQATGGGRDERVTRSLLCSACCSRSPWASWSPRAATTTTVAAAAAAERRAARTARRRAPRPSTSRSMDNAKGDGHVLHRARTPPATRRSASRTFNAKNHQGLTAKLLEFPASATSSATSSSSASRPSPATATSSTPTSSGPPSSRRRSGCST